MRVCDRYENLGGARDMGFNCAIGLRRRLGAEASCLKLIDEVLRKSDVVVERIEFSSKAIFFVNFCRRKF